MPVTIAAKKAKKNTRQSGFTSNWTGKSSGARHRLIIPDAGIGQQSDQRDAELVAARKPTLVIISLDIRQLLLQFCKAIADPGLDFSGEDDSHPASDVIRYVT